MQRFARGVAAAFLLAATLPLSGCDIQGFSLAFRDFDTASIDGIRLWELDESSGQWVPSLDLPFGEIEVRHGVEYVGYDVPWGDDGDVLGLASEVERFGTFDEVVRLRFVFLPLEDGDYRISAFNEFGDSPLSTGTYSL